MPPHHSLVATARGAGHIKDRAGSTKKTIAGTQTASRRSGASGPRGDTALLQAVLWTLRLGVALGLAIALGYLPYKLYLRSGLVQYVTLRQELAALSARNDGLKNSIRELRHQLERMKDDPAAIERVARDELGMVRSGEVVFKVE